MLIAVSSIIDLLVSIYYLSQGTSIVFQNIYYFTIVLAAYWYRWRGALFSCAMSLAYLALSIFYDQELGILLQATIRTVLFILIAIVVAYLSARLEDEKGRYRTIFSTSRSGMVAVRRSDGSIEVANNKFLEIAGTESIKGMNLNTLFTEGANARFEELLKGTGTFADLEMELISRSGGIKPCLISGSTLNSNEMAMSVVDITERKKAKAAIEEANRKLNILSSITRHDTNNMLMILSGQLQLHQRTIVNDDEKKRVDMMSDLVDSLSEHLEFTENYRRLGINSPEWQLVRKTGEEAADRFDHKDVTLTFDVGDIEVMADPMLKKVFYNLIDNSLKHGGVITDIKISSVVSEKNAVIVYEDNGIGIPQDKKEKIFEGGHGRNHGLGLYLIREILKITNIEIKETGTPGSGVRFELTVPLCAFRSGLGAATKP